MKKNSNYYGLSNPRINWHKLLLTMRLTFYLFMFGVFNLIASTSYSQNARISINMNEATVENVLNRIEEVSEFYFLFNHKLIDVQRRISIRADNQPIKNILHEIFTDEVIFVVSDRQIVLTPKSIAKNTDERITQQITVNGYVTDAETGEPMPGVNIQVKGSIVGVITNTEGKYTINVTNQEAVLVFSFIGYKSNEVSVGNRRTIDLALSPEITGLDEVVVIGYGTMKKKDVTGSVASVKTDLIKSEEPQNVQDILRGNVPGLEVGLSMSAKGGGSLEIRGNNSLKTSSAPLIVLDGVIYPGEIEDINPYDIESIDVLKDASSSAVFGARSANGVIMITTKKGSLGKPIINLTSSIGLTSVASNTRIYGPQEFIDWRQNVMKSLNYYNTATNAKLYKFENPDNLPNGITLDQWMDGVTGDPQDIWLSRLGLLPLEKANYIAGRFVDWEDLVYQNGFRQDHNLSVSGKKEDITYYWSVGLNNNEGIIQGDVFKSIRSRLNVESKVTKWVTVGLNTQFTNRDESGIPYNWSVIEKNSPWGSIYEEDGVTLRYRPTDDIGDARIPFYDAYYQERRVIYNTLISNLYSEIKLPLGITYRFTYAPRFEWYGYYNHQSALHYEWSKFGGQADRRQQETFSWQIDNLIKWNKVINDIHQIDLTFLINSEKFMSWQNAMRIQGFSPTDALGYHNMTAGNSETTVISSSDQYETADALMGRAFYSFKNKYMLTLSVRQDGYSAFGLRHPRGLFPSVALGWVFTDENFLKNNILTYGKLRVSWGENGNREVGRYVALADMGLSKYSYQSLNGKLFENNMLYVNRMANADLRWEKTRALNFGVDFSIYNGLLDGTLEIYRQSTLDLLVDRALPNIVGTESVVSNLGQVDNKGIELSLNARVMDKSNFKWRSSFSFYLNRNKIVHLYGDMVDIYDSEGNIIGQKEADDISNKWFIGHAIDEIWDPVVLGIWQLGEEEEAARYGQFPGDFKLKDVDNSGTINYLDHEFQGFTSPRFRWNLRNDFKISKNLDFSFTMYSYWGHFDTFNSAKNRDGRYPDRLNSYVTPYWTPEKPSNTWARIASSEGGAKFSVYREKSFIRLDNVTVTYTVPKSLIDRMHLTNLSVYGTIRNVGWWAPHWELTDPEKVKSSSWQVQEPDNYGPTPRYFTLGLNFTF